jgi:hypothetical protein
MGKDSALSAVPCTICEKQAILFFSIGRLIEELGISYKLVFAVASESKNVFPTWITVDGDLVRTHSKYATISRRHILVPQSEDIVTNTSWQAGDRKEFWTRDFCEWMEEQSVDNDGRVVQHRLAFVQSVTVFNLKFHVSAHEYDQGQQ